MHEDSISLSDGERQRETLREAVAPKSAAFYARDAIGLLAHWEIHANGAAYGAVGEPFAVEYFRIPIRLAEGLIASPCSSAIKDALYEEIGGELYYRWIVNPDDLTGDEHLVQGGRTDRQCINTTSFRAEVAKFLADNGCDSDLHTAEHLIARRTASRSILITDTHTGQTFSQKASTFHAAGRWSDKGLEARQVRWMREVTDYVRAVTEKIAFDHLIFLFEPAAVALGGNRAGDGREVIPQIDQGIIFRDLTPVADGCRYFIPGFSLLDERLGSLIALANGETDPRAFWLKHCAKIAGRADGEAYAHLGIEQTSPHLQQRLFEFDLKFQPTGRQALRDFGDSLVHREYLAGMPDGERRARWLEKFPHRLFCDERGDTLDRKGIAIGVSFVKGSVRCSWMTHEKYREFDLVYHEAFRGEVAALSGIPEIAHSGVQLTLGDDTNYSYFSYDLAAPEWQRFLKIVPQLQGEHGECPESVRAKMRSVPHGDSRPTYFTPVEAAFETLLVDQGALGSSEREELCTLTKEFPEEACRALLRKLIRNENIAEVRSVALPVLEGMADELFAGERSEFFVRALIELGSCNEAVLIRQLESCNPVPGPMLAAIYRIVEKQGDNPKCHLALARAGRNLPHAEHFQRRDVIEAAQSALVELGVHDLSVIEEVLDTARSHFTSPNDWLRVLIEESGVIPESAAAWARDLFFLMEEQKLSLGDMLASTILVRDPQFRPIIEEMIGGERFSPSAWSLKSDYERAQMSIEELRKSRYFAYPPRNSVVSAEDPRIMITYKGFQLSD